MLKTVFLTSLTLLIALGGGAASVYWALANVEGIGALVIGDWTAYPEAGTRAADPYTKARIAREAELPLGQAEGLSFVARADSSGRPLQRGCSYEVVGTVPTTRFWTLYAADKDLVAIPPEGRYPPALHSHRILYAANDAFTIGVGPHAMPGNWLPVQGSGPMALVLTLYDTPAASSSSISDVELPHLVRIGCGG